MASNKREDRERRLRVQRRNLKLKYILALIGCGLVIGGLISVYRSDVFMITDVVVEGSERVSADEVRALAGLEVGETLLRVSPDDVETEILRNPWIETAEVSRRFPDTLRIVIGERRPFALVDHGGAAFLLLDSAGHVLEERTPDSTTTVIVIRDVPDLTAGPGERIDSPVLQNALAVWSGLSTEMRGMVRAISAPSIDRTALITRDDVEVFVGSAEDIERKDVVARSILAEQAGTVVYINVRSVDRPTYRGLDSP